MHSGRQSCPSSSSHWTAFLPIMWRRLWVLSSRLVPSLRSRVRYVCWALISPAVSLTWQVRQLLHKAYRKLKKLITFFHLFKITNFFLRQSPCTPACPEIYHADQAGFRLTAGQAGLASQTLGFKVCTTIPHPAINIVFFFLKKKIFFKNLKYP